MDEMGARIARIEEQIKELGRRMETLEKLTESVHSLTLTVRDLVNQQAQTEQDVETLSSDVKDMKEKPAKRWDAIVAALIAGVVGAGIGHFIK
jgi:archaellum component FlaC